jgi:hypothetical protein
MGVHGLGPSVPEQVQVVGSFECGTETSGTYWILKKYYAA